MGLEELEKQAAALEEDKVDWWKPTATDNLFTGTVISLSRMDSKFQKDQLIIVVMDKNGHKRGRGCNAALEQQLKDKRVELGDLIAIKWCGIRKTKNGQNMNTFNCIVEKPGIPAA